MRGSIIKRKGKNGIRYAIRFIDQEGKRHYKTAGTRKVDAEKALATALTQVHHRDYRELKDISFKNMAVKWLAAHAANVRPNTLASYREHLEKRIIPYFGDRKLRNISTEDIEVFKAHLMTQDISAATVGKHLCTLKMMLKTAMQWQYLSTNPAQFVKRPLHTKPEASFLLPGEVEQLIAATDTRYYCLMLTACMTGVRQGELLGLQWGDIDFANNRIYVRRTLQAGKFYEPKSAASRRSVSVPVPVIQALKEHQARQAVELDENKIELVFPNEVGQPMDSRNMVHRVFEAALKRSGLPRIRFHDLRHSYAAALISAGENIKWIQKQLGHSSIQVTMDVYGHLLPDIERNAPARLEAILMPGLTTMRPMVAGSNPV